MAKLTLERFVQELEKLKADMDAGRMRPGEYDTRLARVITEANERGLDADKKKLEATLDDALRRGVLTPTGKSHLLARLHV